MRTVAAILLFCISALATAPNCLVQFAMTSPDDPDGVALSLATYENLFDTLGGQANAETLRKMAANNPFEVPDQNGTDLGTIKKHLKEFEALITRRGWNTPGVREKLVASLDSRARNTGQGKQAVDRAGKDLWSDFDVPTEFWIPAHAVSPDGNWLAILDLPEENFSRTGALFHLTNLNTRQTKTYSYPAEPAEKMNGRIAFTPDGNSVVLFTEDKRARQVPLVDHVPDWTHLKKLNDYLMLATSPRRMGSSENQSYVYSETNNPIRRTHLQTHRTERADVTDEMFESGKYIARRSGSVGTTDSAYVHLENKRVNAKLVAFDFGPDGKPLNPRTLAQWSNGLGLEVVYWNKANEPITQLGMDFYEWPTPTKPKLLYQPSGNGRGPEPLRNYRQFEGDGSGSTIVMMLILGDKRWAEVFDLEKKRVTASFALPDHTDKIQLTPDGKRLIVKIKNQTRVMNYLARVDE